MTQKKYEQICWCVLKDIPILWAQEMKSEFE